MTKNNKITYAVVGILLLIFVLMIFEKKEGLETGSALFSPIVVGAALIDSINPCAFGILLLTIALLVSFGKERKRIIVVGASYITGIFAIYLAVGLGIARALYLFDTPHGMTKIGASIVILLGILGLLGELFPRFPVKFKIPERSHGTLAGLMEKASIPTAFLLGVLVGVYEFPCTGGPYLMILGLLHDNSTRVSGIGYLFLYNLIFVLPLVIILVIASSKNVLGKIEEWKKRNLNKAKVLASIAMIILGVIMFLL